MAIVKKKAPAKKTAPKKKMPTKKMASKTKKTPSKNKKLDISDIERMQMIATAAYFKAEQRGFVGGDPDEDWAEAEKEVEQLLSKK